MQCLTLADVALYKQPFLTSTDQPLATATRPLLLKPHLGQDNWSIRMV